MLRFLMCGFVLIFSGVAIAAPPVVVEFFGQNSCKSDSDLQKTFVSLLEAHENLIIVNCRQWYDAKAERNEGLLYSHKFCNDRMRSYRDQMRERAVIVVNGRWSANIQDVSPAIKLARLDQAGNIDVSFHHDKHMLEIGLPDLGRAADGQVYVYAYAPTQGDFTYQVDPDLELTNELRMRVQNGESVPFVTKTEASQYLFRPVLGRAYVGAWDGQDERMDYKLSELTAFVGDLPYEDISYAVVVHEKDSLGPVLASGEYVSLKEQAYLFPKSEPVQIERVSAPPAVQPLPAPEETN